MKTTIFETERLILEPLTVNHAVGYFNIAANPALYRYIPRDPPASLEKLTDRYKGLVDQISSDGTEIWLNWFIRIKDLSRAYIGKLEATIVQDGKAYIAYEIDPNFQGKGYATEACRAMIGMLQTDYNVQFIQAHVDTRNERSIKLLERLGLMYVQTLKDADFFKGSTSDEYVYELK